MRKNLHLCLCGVVSCMGVALASNVSQDIQNNHGTYLGFMLGGAYHVGWNQFARSDWHHASWGWTIGADMGYRFNDYMSAEFGGYWTQKVKTILSDQRWHQHWLGYLALKVQRPLLNHWDIFTKFGVGINRWSYKLAGIPLQSDNGYVPVFALGSDIYVSHNLALELQYLRFGQSWDTIDRWGMTTNALDLLTVGLTYHLRM